MDGARKRRGGVVGREGLSGRLLLVLVREIDRLEEAAKRCKLAIEGVPERGAAHEGIDAGAKGRIEAIGQVTRTLEKLLELQRLEALAMRGEDEDGEAVELAAELMRRLRSLDARRERPTLFGADGAFGRTATDGMTAGSGGGAEAARGVEDTVEDIGRNV